MINVNVKRLNNVSRLHNLKYTLIRTKLWPSLQKSCGDFVWKNQKFFISSTKVLCSLADPEENELVFRQILLSMSDLMLATAITNIIETNFWFGFWNLDPAVFSLRFFTKFIGALRSFHLLIQGHDDQHMTYSHPCQCQWLHWNHPGRSRYPPWDTSPPPSGAGRRTLPSRIIHLPQSEHTHRP